MVIELLEIRDPASLYKVAKAASIIVRIDPLIIIPLYRLTFFLDLRKIDRDDISEIFRILREKIVIIDNTYLEDSLTSFIKKRFGDLES
jgi:hypothetical protein